MLPVHERSLQPGNRSFDMIVGNTSDPMWSDSCGSRDHARLGRAGIRDKRQAG